MRQPVSRWIVACCSVALILGCGEAPPPPETGEGRRAAISGERSALQRGPAGERREARSLLDGAVTLSSPYGFELLVPRSWKRGALGRSIVFQAPQDAGKLPTLTITVSSFENQAALDRFELKRIAAGARPIKLAGGSALRREWVAKLTGRACLQVSTLLPGRRYLALLLACDRQQRAAFSPLFEQILIGFGRTGPRRPTPSYRVYRHPLGLSLEIPRGWRGFRSERRVLFAPAREHPIRPDQRVPLVVAVTPCPPQPLSSFARIERFLGADFARRGLKLQGAAGPRLAGVESWAFRWHDPRKRERVRQLCLFHHGALVAITMTRRDDWQLPLDELFGHALDSLRLQ